MLPRYAGRVRSGARIVKLLDTEGEQQCHLAPYTPSF